MTSPVSIPAGHELVAADFDAYENLTAAWSTYACTWRSSGTQPALGNGSLTAVYRQTGKTVDAKINLVIGSTSTFGTGFYYFDLPFTSARETTGTGRAIDSSINSQLPALGMVSALAGLPGLAFISMFSTSTNALWTASAPMTWATGDSGSMEVTFDLA